MSLVLHRTLTVTCRTGSCRPSTAKILRFGFPRCVSMLIARIVEGGTTAQTV